MNLYGPLNTGAAAGGAGVATANASSTSRVKGLVLAVYVRYNDSPPAGTTDITIATAGTTMPAATILVIANAATDGWFYPVVQNNLSADGTAVAGQYTPLTIDDLIKVTIAQANNDDSIDVWVLTG